MCDEQNAALSALNNDSSQWKCIDNEATENWLADGIEHNGRCAQQYCLLIHMASNVMSVRREGEWTSLELVWFDVRCRCRRRPSSLSDYIIRCIVNR